jgi:WD40 repeat protein/serine/threonine protein kinase
MATLTISLLGKYRASLHGDQLPGFRTIKAQGLLIYLAAELSVRDSRVHKREELMTLLWPGLPERSARHNLRQVIYYLRKAIPELPRKPGASAAEWGDTVQLLLSNRQTISLHPAADIEVDISKFEALINATQMHEHIDLFTCRHCLNDLEQAAILYRDDFLADFYLDDSDEYEDWAQARREFYRRKILDALETLTTIHGRQKAFAEARTYAERQLEIDNLRESAHRQLMEIMALSGQRSEAMVLYENFRRLLAEELGMEPSARTTDIYQKIMAGDLAFDVPLAQGVRGYRLKEEIGEGAYGSIHLAVQPAIGREVAVKVIRRKYANDAEFIRRFEAEAQTIARLEHPHIVPLYDYWRDPDGAYIVMRYIRGGNLLNSLEAGPWEPEPAIKLMDQISGALNAAHRQGVVHRDIKPANILLDEGRNAYLSDFGIAKSLSTEMQMTATGAILGTPDYISPEQIKNEPVGPETDIYSLGAVLYETLAGEKPFPDSSVANLIYKHLNDPMPLVSTSRPDLPVQIDNVIQRATAKRPDDRYADALEMADAFRRAVRGMDVTKQVIDASVFLAEEDVVNPFKGLRPFQEADADNFFGREVLVEQLVERLTPSKSGRDRESRFLAVVGPSGSGKSSAVKAGLIPALREGAIPGSEKWFVAEMVPGTHPLEELELALWPVAVDPPPSLVEPMQRDIRGMLRTIRRVLPDEEDAQLLLVIDQFEELFTLVDDEERRVFFIDSLLSAIGAPRSPLRVVVTLRADFYDRPLQIQPLAKWIRKNTELAIPMTPEELTWAIREPARRMGVGLEDGLAEAIVADVADQPGALPMLQYTLTELFESRRDNLMTKSTYEEVGGVMGALRSRAEEIYADFNVTEKELTRQLFLRLVTLGEGIEDTRRRVLRTELESLFSDDLGLQADREKPGDISIVLERFGEARLLTFDRDPATREPTMEVAHEALLREWRRLRAWLDESRADVRLQRVLSLAASEWVNAEQAPGFLLRGSRLDQFTGWADSSTVALTQIESDFLEANVVARETRLAEEEVRRQRELETARQLAKTEKARAEEQARSAGNLRRRAVYLGLALAVALFLAVAAALFARQSNQNATLAEEREAVAIGEAGQRATAQAETEIERLRADEERDAAVDAQATAESERQRADDERTVAVAAQAAAEAERQRADEEREIAEEQTRLTRSRELALAALRSLEDDPQRGMLLALEALNVAHTREAEEALHYAILTSRNTLLLDDHGADIKDVAFSPDGTFLVTASEDTTIKIRDPISGEPQLVLSIEDHYPYMVSISPDSKYVATQHLMGPLGEPDDSEINVWDAANGDLLLTIDGGDDIINSVAYSPDGNLLYGTTTSYLYPDILAWDTSSGEELLRIEGVAEDQEAELWHLVAVSPDGKKLATTPNTNLVPVYDAISGQTLYTLTHEMDTTWDIVNAVFNPNATQLATDDGQGTLYMWDVLTGELLYTAETGLPAGQMGFSPDGKLIALMRKGIAILDTETGADVLTLPRVSTGVDVVFSPEGDRLASIFGNNFYIWDLAPITEIMTLQGSPDSMARSDLSRDGSLIATADDYGWIRLFDAVKGEILWEAQGHDDWSGSLDFGPDNVFLASGSDDGTIAVWDIQQGEQLVKWQSHDAWVNGIAVSPDGTHLVSVHQDGAVKMWDSVTGTGIWTRTHPLAVWGVAFDPSGELLATGYLLTGTVTLWDAHTGENAGQLEGPQRAAISIVFDPNGVWLAAGDTMGVIRIWDLESEEAMHTIEAHPGAIIWKMAVNQDGTRLATIGGETIRWWDVETGDLLLTLPYEGFGENIDFDSETQHLFAGTENGIQVYTLDSDELVALAHSRLSRGLTSGECAQYRIDPCPADSQ